jgi:AcrR family transcriptional regulator
LPFGLKEEQEWGQITDSAVALSLAAANTDHCTLSRLFIAIAENRAGSAIRARFIGMSRRQRTRRNDGVHPTYATILDQAIVVLIEDGFDRFNVQRVLDGAGVSRATLYNHFTDVDTLIEAALVATFSQETDLYRARLAGIVENAPDHAAFRQALRLHLEDFSHLPAAVRLRRTHTIALSATRPNLAASITAIQDQITQTWSATIRDAQERGFVRSELDPHTTAVMVLSITLGRIVDDAASNHIGDERWASAMFDIIDRAMLTPEH